MQLYLSHPVLTDLSLNHLYTIDTNIHTIYSTFVYANLSRLRSCQCHYTRKPS